MKTKKAAGSAIAIILIAAISSAILIVVLSSLLLDVPDSVRRIDTLEDGRTESAILDLPLSSFLPRVLDGGVIVGSIAVTTGSDIDSIYVFLPYYVGTLDVSIGDQRIYASPFPARSRILPRVNSVAIEVVNETLFRQLGSNRTVEITISVLPDGSGLAVLSEIYVGSAQDFETQLQRSYLYYDVIRNAVLGVQVFLLLLGIALFRSASVGLEIFAPLIILGYLTSYGVAAVFSQLQLGLDPSSYIVPSTPAVSVALFLYGWQMCGGQILDIYRNPIYFFIFAWLAFVVVADLFSINLILMNVFLSAPSILVSMLLVVVMSVRSLRVKSTIEVQMLLFGVTSLLLLTAHDVAFRIGLHTNGVAISPLGSLAFFSVLGYTSLRQYFVSQQGLAEANANLTQALKAQSTQLNLEFARTADLMRTTAAQEETARMTRELHDGVLTYLGLINVISEMDSNEGKEQVAHLSRIATNEIRVILESRPNESASLAIALSSLRQNMVDPLHLQNIHVEWSIAELLNYGPLAPESLMDVVRIVQEAIHNAVVRADCKSLSVVAEKCHGVYRIRVSNLGGQTYSCEERVGRGIPNMKDRAAKIGGSLSIYPIDTGASLLLTLPNNKLLQ